MANRIAATAMSACALAIGMMSVTSHLAAQAPAKGSGTVEITGPIRVIDGDTFEVYINGHQTAIGMIGIKVPQGNTPCGRRAAQFIQGLVNVVDALGPITLRFEEDPAQTFDAHKRRLYYLKLPGDISAALAMVGAGFADPDGSGSENAALANASRLASKCVG